ADASEDAAEGGVDPFGGKARIEVGEIGHLLYPYLVSVPEPPRQDKNIENNPMHSSGIIGGAANRNS
ncbi:hypothetical protein, partial [Bradyrhizobium liaoningense]|uniref:hypothetical protein n=1 Tax=Bradyrhizobium liaoningense TaxID=43992 RepID=UPI0012FDA0A9